MKRLAVLAHILSGGETDKRTRKTSQSITLSTSASSSNLTD